MKTEHWLLAAVCLVVGAFIVPAIISALPTLLMIVGAFAIARVLIRFLPSKSKD